MWKAEQYDLADWADLFRRAGADYVIPVTKHHDGVTLWDAPGAGGLTTVARGPRRDLLAPLADEVRGRGMRFGVYYSGGLDWAVTSFPPIDSLSAVNEMRPNDAAYAAYATAQVRDLVDRYQPAVIWNDIDWPDAGKADGSLQQLLAHYRSVVPDGVVNDRWGAEVWDYRTSEYAHDTHHESGVGWEHNRGLGFSFGYNQIEDESLTLSPRELARLYADVVARGGRLLLNVGPEASGRIPKTQRSTLEGFAAWMSEAKSLTTRRAPLDSGVVTVEGASWWRAWASDNRIIVIVERKGAVVRSADARPITVLPLPLT